MTDGNVVLSDGSNPVWASNTAGHRGAYFAIQNDGNLVVYSSSGKALFNTGTPGGRQGTLSASARWIRDRNLKRFPGLKFSTVVSKATGKALDAGGKNNSVYPHPSPNSGNEFHQWGFEKVGDYYMIINKATGKALDGGRDGGKLPYVHPDPTRSNPYQLWKLPKVGDAYLIVNKATGRALDSGANNSNQIYMHPTPMSWNNFHLWKLDLPNSGGEIVGKFQPINSRAEYLKRLYGSNPSAQITQNPRAHGGPIDSWAGLGANLYALAGGEVIEARNGINYGAKSNNRSNWVNNGTIAIYNKELDMIFIYWHLQKGSINTSLNGKTIAAGTLIGKEGKTGYVIGPSSIHPSDPNWGVHTHVEVHKGRVNINMAIGQAPANSGRLYIPSALGNGLWS